jgi:hypothetical protein
VYVALGPGTVAIDVDNAVTGKGPSIAGLLSGTVGSSSIEVTLSLDDNYVFVSQEDGNDATGLRGAIEVFNVHRARNGSVSSKYIGYTVLDYAVVGTALSTDGSKLYAASELGSTNSTQGTLSILNVKTLRTILSKALLSSVDAGLVFIPSFLCLLFISRAVMWTLGSQNLYPNRSRHLRIFSFPHSASCIC